MSTLCGNAMGAGESVLAQLTAKLGCSQVACWSIFQVPLSKEGNNKMLCENKHANSHSSLIIAHPILLVGHGHGGGQCTMQYLLREQTAKLFTGTGAHRSGSTMSSGVNHTHSNSGIDEPILAVAALLADSRLMLSVTFFQFVDIGQTVLSAIITACGLQRQVFIRTHRAGLNVAVVFRRLYYSQLNIVLCKIYTPKNKRKINCCAR